MVFGMEVIGVLVLRTILEIVEDNPNQVGICTIVVLGFLPQLVFPFDFLGLSDLFGEQVA